jgi:hypothetical protein
MKNLEQNRKLILERLSGAGWSSTRTREGAQEVAVEYHNGKLALELLENTLDESELALDLFIESDEEHGVHLQILFGDDPDTLAKLVAELIAFQDVIEEANLQDCARRLLRVTPSILVEADDDLVPLEDEP